MQIDKGWSPFATQDPLNNNFVEGHICRHQGDDYGALLISKVNGEKAPQLIYATPKIAYPFDRNGNWHFPKARVILRYEKLDGTNIFAYRYRDAKEQEYLSYKTRLLPFLQNSRFGPFLSMWKEMLAQYPEIGKLPFLLGKNLSFELWGARNPHLIKYQEPLVASLLFLRDGQKILPPHSMEGSIRCSSLRGEVTKDSVWEYEESQKAMDTGLVEVEDGYTGTEGEVWYLQVESGEWVLFKCKPETIEAIHWAAGGLGKNTIIATCENAFENWDDPTVEQVQELLLEEFSAQTVEKAHLSIVKHLQETKEKHLFGERVLVAYRALGMSVLEQKAEVMRALAPQFSRSEMRKVYSCLWAHEGSM